MKWPNVRPRKGYHGVYINLDREIDRRRRIERELRKRDLEDTYIRLPAIDGRGLSSQRRFSSFAEGCFRSHAAAVNLARSALHPVHVIEDDTRFSRYVAAFIPHASDTGLLDRFDILFLDMWVEPNLKQIARWDQLYRRFSGVLPDDLSALTIAEMTEFPCRAASSYVVNPRGAQKLHSCLQAEMERGPRMPVDRYIGELSKKGDLSVAVVVPFLTAVDPETGSSSDIQLRMDAEHIRTLLFFRAAFYIDTDLESEILPRLDAKIEMTQDKTLRSIRHLLSTRRHT